MSNYLDFGLDTQLLGFIFARILLFWKYIDVLDLKINGKSVSSKENRKAVLDTGTSNIILDYGITYFLLSIIKKPLINLTT